MYEKIVATQNGKIEGFPEHNPAITSYKGVPYAKPPVGALRWMSPQALEPWDGIIKADTFGGMPLHRQIRPLARWRPSKCIHSVPALLRVTTM